jgi:two-component system chemotaxis response regulator CheY
MTTVLIVDDSPIMRRNLRSILTQAGCQVIAEAGNGEEGYQAYEKHQPDLVTMDITMPIMNGIQAVKKIVSAYPEARIIVISAFDQRNMVFEAMESGARNYIIKPITAEKLLQKLDQVLQDDNGSRHE